MPQTMLSFLAVMIVTGLIMGQQRLKIRAQRDAVNAQYEVMASAVAAERMQYIASHPYDAKTADGTVSRSNKDEDLLTTKMNFGTGDVAACVVASACKDIDDFHAHKDTVAFADDGSGVEFAIDTEVIYVNDDGTPAMSPTWTKEVTITVQALPLDAEAPFLVAPVTKTRRFSPHLTN